MFTSNGATLDADSNRVLSMLWYSSKTRAWMQWWEV